jgi:hypothetical protein
MTTPMPAHARAGFLRAPVALLAVSCALRLAVA